MRAFISIGSNIDADIYVPKGLEFLSRQALIEGVSTFYRSGAIGRPEQPDYLNGVCAIETAIPPRALKFRILRTIEAACGRSRGEDAYAPRTLDLDILLYGDRIIRERGLVVPDPDLTERGFLCAGLYELAGDIAIPGLGRSLGSIVRGFDLEAAGIIADPAFSERLAAFTAHV